MNDYPDNWHEIATGIKTLAGWQCEHCQHPHDIQNRRVLTVHHLDGDKANCCYQNLVALCQVCHLHIQAVYFPGQQSFAKYDWAVKRGLM